MKHFKKEEAAKWKRQDEFEEEAKLETVKAQQSAAAPRRAGMGDLFSLRPVSGDGTT